MDSSPASSMASLAAPANNRLSASSSSSSSASSSSASKPVTHSDLEGLMASFAKMVSEKIDQQKDGLDAKISAAVKNAVDALPRSAGASGASSSSAPASSSAVCAVAAADGDLVQSLAAAIRGAGLGNGGGAGDSESDEDELPVAGAAASPAGAFTGAGASAKSIAAVAAVNTPQRVAPLVLQLVQQYGSLSHWVHFVQWKKLRNKNECAALAETADVLLAEGVKTDSMGLELLLRRLNGVHLADTYGDWSVCSALQWSGPNGTLLDRSSLVGALKYANQLKKLQPVSADAPKKNFNSNFKPKGGKRYDGDARPNPAPKAAAGAKEGAQHK